jgi:hypothetical protein
MMNISVSPEIEFMFGSSQLLPRKTCEREFLLRDSVELLFSVLVYEIH